MRGTERALSGEFPRRLFEQNSKSNKKYKVIYIRVNRIYGL